MKFIAVDVGSTNVKCAVVNTETRSINEWPAFAFPAPNAGIAEGRYEIDAKGLFERIRAIINEMLCAEPETKGILFSVQMHGFVLTDEGNSAITPYVSWRDAASAELSPSGMPFIEELREVMPQAAWRETGVPLKTKLAAANLYARVRQGLAWPAKTKLHTLDGYINAKLGAKHACHISMAASTGFCDANNGAWSRPIIEAVSCDTLAFPQIYNKIDSIGSYAFGGRSYALYPGVGDHQACTLGSLAAPETDAVLNIGTGGMAGRITPQFSYECETRPYFGGYFIRTITGLPGGRHLQQYAEGVAKILASAGFDNSLSRTWSLLTQVGTSAFSEATDALYFDFAEKYAQAVRDLGEGVSRIVCCGGAITRNPPLIAHVERATGLPCTFHCRDAALNGLLEIATKFI